VIRIVAVLSLPLAACIAIFAAAQAHDVPGWQAAAGGTMSFDVASVKPNRKYWYPAFPFDSGNVYKPTGLFSASLPLWSYIEFAYKLGPNLEQRQAAVAKFPKGLSPEEYFEIDARAEGQPSKDQLRLMLQSLLADRFQPSVHFETRDTAVFALSLARPGKTGPRLRRHDEGPPCEEFATPPPGPPVVGSIFPKNCEFPQMAIESNGIWTAGERNATMASVAEAIYRFGVGAGAVDKPVVDETGLAGRFDFTVEYTPEFLRARADTPDAPGKPFPQALPEQLGLKLTPSRAPITTLIVDRVERPSEN
jgi:bla regulator protein blaR1